MNSPTAVVERLDGTSVMVLNALNRRLRVMTLRRQGLDYFQIAERINADIPEEERGIKDYDATKARADVRTVMNMLRGKLREEAQDMMEIDLARMDELLQHWYPLALSRPSRGDPDDEDFDPGQHPSKDAADVVMRILERRARMLGYDKGVDLAEADKILIIKTIRGMPTDHFPGLPGADNRAVEDATYKMLPADLATAVEDTD